MDKSKKMLKKLIAGTLKSPDDLSPKRLLELMTEYIQAGKTAVDDAAVLSQICVVIRDLTNAKEMSSMVTKMEQEFVNCDGMKILKEFMHRNCGVLRSRVEDRDLHALLLYTMLSGYYLLLMLTTYCHPQIWTCFVQEGFPGVIAEDLHHNSYIWWNVFKDNGVEQIDGMGPMIGMSLIENCVSVGAFPREVRASVSAMLDNYIDERENKIDLVILAISLNYDLNPINTIHKFIFTGCVFEKCAELLNSCQICAGNPSYITTRETVPPGFELAWRVQLQSLLKCILTLATSDDYKCRMTLAFQNSTKTFDEILTNGDSMEKELVEHLFQLLCRHTCSKCSWSYIGDLMLKHGIMLVPTDPKSVESHLQGEGAAGAITWNGKFQCRYMQDCDVFLRNLDLDDEGVSLIDQYLDPDYHRCFCPACMNSRQDVPVYRRGEPPKKYALPTGWAKFAIKVPPRAIPLQIFPCWQMAFHGTTKPRLQKILQAGKLSLEGSVAEGRSQGRGGKTIYVSPSIRYASLDSSEHVVQVRNGVYRGQIAFQVRIYPQCYKVIQERHQLEQNYDEHFRNNELEWATDDADSIIIVGILIKVRRRREI